MNIPMKYEDVVAKLDAAERRKSERECQDCGSSSESKRHPVDRLSYSQGDRRYVNGWNDACSHWEDQSAQHQGEPVYQLRNTKLGFVWRDADFEAYASAAKLLDYERRIMYAEETAPVAVVIPERCNERDHAGDFTYEAKGWNSCLDALAKLNGIKS